MQCISNSLNYWFFIKIKKIEYGGHPQPLYYSRSPRRSSGRPQTAPSFYRSFISAMETLSYADGLPTLTVSWPSRGPQPLIDYRMEKYFPARQLLVSHSSAVRLRKEPLAVDTTSATIASRQLLSVTDRTASRPPRTRLGLQSLMVCFLQGAISLPSGGHPP